MQHGEAQGGARLVRQEDLGAETLSELVRDYMENPDSLVSMARNAKNAGEPDATRLLGDLVVDIASGSSPTQQSMLGLAAPAAASLVVADAAGAAISAPPKIDAASRLGIRRVDAASGGARSGGRVSASSSAGTSPLALAFRTRDRRPNPPSTSSARKPMAAAMRFGMESAVDGGSGAPLSTLASS